MSAASAATEPPQHRPKPEKRPKRSAIEEEGGVDYAKEEEGGVDAAKEEEGDVNSAKEEEGGVNSAKEEEGEVNSAKEEEGPAKEEVHAYGFLFIVSLVIAENNWFRNGFNRSLLPDWWPSEINSTYLDELCHVVTKVNSQVPDMRRKSFTIVRKQRC